MIEIRLPMLIWNHHITANNEVILGLNSCLGLMFSLDLTLYMRFRELNHPEESTRGMTLRPQP